MASSRIHFADQPVSLAEQVVVMKQCFPNFKVRWHKNIIHWTGEVQPSPLSKRYLIKITHQLHKLPKVLVLKPKLEKGENGRIPHTYPGDRLCLYHPKKQEWNQQKHIANTIVPWTSLWLHYYELWQATGEWLGEGEHPEIVRPARSPIRSVRDMH